MRRSLAGPTTHHQQLGRISQKDQSVLLVASSKWLVKSLTASVRHCLWLFLSALLYLSELSRTPAV